MTINWQPVPSHPVLDPEGVTLWCLKISAWQGLYSMLFDQLSADEQARANRFKFAKHQHRFAIARGGLRLILSRYLSCLPSQLQFGYAQNGKPFLADLKTDEVEILPLRFNLSHSEDLAIYAISQSRELGVDLEHMRPMADQDQLVQRFFSAQESLAFTQLNTSDKPLAFFQAWTQKEAYLKAIGTGLKTPLDQVEVVLQPRSGQSSLRVVGKAHESERWQITPFQPDANYMGALVVERCSSKETVAIAGHWLNPQEVTCRQSYLKTIGIWR